MCFGIYRCFIFELIKTCAYKSYLELGVWRGDMLWKVAQICPNVVGVDILEQRTCKVGKFYEMSTAEFFKQNKDTYDVIFIDASHKIEDVIFDLRHSIKILNKYGTIILHDTDPISEDMIREDKCGDVVKINFMEFEGLNMITLPVGEEGITLLRRKEETRTSHESHFLMGGAFIE